ncbi:hypothetical protein MRX96_016564 [Rhipicephalus microplus]
MVLQRCAKPRSAGFIGKGEDRAKARITAKPANGPFCPSANALRRGKENVRPIFSSARTTSSSPSRECLQEKRASPARLEKRVSGGKKPSTMYTPR